MKRNKRQRKVRSANKLLKKQKKALDAIHCVQLTCMAAGAAATISLVRAAKFAKGGHTKEAAGCLAEATEQIIDVRGTSFVNGGVIGTRMPVVFDSAGVIRREGV